MDLNLFCKDIADARRTLLSLFFCMLANSKNIFIDRQNTWISHAAAIRMRSLIYCTVIGWCGGADEVCWFDFDSG